MHCNGHSGVYRALVTYSNTQTGEILVKIPSVAGVDSIIPISYIGRSSSNDYWSVPKIGEQIVVTTDDENLNNVFWVQVEPYNPGTKEPTGFSDIADSVVSFNNTTRTFTISPVSDNYEVWVRGIKYEISEPLSIVIPNTHGGHNIYFDASGTLQTKTTFFDLEWEAPVSFIYWNTVSAIMFADERHGTTMDWQTHEYLHRTRGAQFSRGFEISGYTTTGTGNTVADCKLDIANGTFFDEDLQIDVTHATSPVANTFQQRLQSGAYLPVYYRDAFGWQKTTATQYPVKFGTTYPQYNLNVSSLAEMSNNRFGIAWIVATNGLNEPVISIMGQEEYANIGDARAALWSNVLLPDFPSYEFRPLWKVIFQAVSGTAIKAAIREINDLRTFVGTAASGGSVYNNYSFPQTVESVTTRVLTSNDVGKILTSSANCTLTVTNTTNFVIGQRVDIVRLSGTLNVFQGSGATLLFTPATTLRAINSSASIVCIATHTYLLVGDLG